MKRLLKNFYYIICYKFVDYDGKIIVKIIVLKVI